MGFSSQAGQVLFRTQPTPGVFAPDFAAEAVAMKLRSGALGANRDLLITDPEIGGGRDRSDAYLGAISWAGDYEFYARMEALPTLLAACLGSRATAAGVPVAGANQHTLTPLDSATLPYLSIEEAIGGTYEKMHYTDAVVNTFHLEAEANGFLMGTVGVIARHGLAGVTATAADTLWDNSPLIVGTNITLTLGAVSLPAKSFSLDINNNFEDDDFRLGAFELGDLTAKGREVNGSFMIRPADSALWRRSVLGTAVATVAGGLVTKDELVITCETYEFITGTTKSSIEVTVGQIALEPYSLSPSGDDVIENDISWQGLRPDPANDVLSAVVTSGRATI